MDCSLPGSSVHGIFQAIVLEWIAISFSRGYSQTRDWTQVSHIVDRHFTVWATREVQKSFSIYFSFLVPSFLSLYLLPTLFPPPIPSIYCTVELQCCVSFSFILYPEKKHLYFFSRLISLLLQFWLFPQNWNMSSSELHPFTHPTNSYLHWFY